MENEETKKPRDRFVLFTNLDYVSIGPVRTQSHALLLQEGDFFAGMGLRRQARGFGTESSWPVFDIDLSTIEYEIQPAKSPHIFISDAHPEPRPLSTGAILKVGDVSMQLWACDSDRDIDVWTIEGEHGARTILKVWDHLATSVALHWTAPNMPRLDWIPSIASLRRGRR